MLIIASHSWPKEAVDVANTVDYYIFIVSAELRKIRDVISPFAVGVFIAIVSCDGLVFAKAPIIGEERQHHADYSSVAARDLSSLVS